MCNLEKNSSDKITMVIHNFNTKVHNDDRVAISMLTLADGVTLAMKL